MAFSVRHCCLFLFVFLLFTLSFFFSSVPPLYAQSGNGTTTLQNGINTLSPANVDSTVAHTQSNWVQTVMIDVISAMTCQIAGINTANPQQQCLGTNAVTGKIGVVPNNMGLLGMLSNGIGVLYTPPAHTADYVHYLSGNFGLVKHTYAATTDTTCTQGTGFCSLQPLLPIWTVFRNISYLLFVIVFILIGFAIMLRVKINPQTVVSVQNAIPRVIIGLLLITFSYAIAGLLIDLMYVSIVIIINLGVSIDAPTSIGNCNGTTAQCVSLGQAVNQIQGNNPIGFVSSLTGISDSAWGASGAMGNAIGGFFTGPGASWIVGLVVGIFTGILSSSILGLWGIVGGSIAGFVAGTYSQQIVSLVAHGLAFLIIAIAIFISLIRVWIMLIKAYIFILLDVVFAPFWVILALAPKSRFTFVSWLRNMVANLSVFPAVIALFLLAKIFIDYFNHTPDLGFNAQNNTTGLFIPPLIGANGIGTNSTVGGILGLGFILLAPGALTIIRTALQAPETKALQNIPQGIRAGIAPLAVVAGAVGSRYFRKGEYGKEAGIGRTYGFYALRKAWRTLRSPRENTPRIPNPLNKESRTNAWNAIKSNVTEPLNIHKRNVEEAADQRAARPRPK